MSSNDSNSPDDGSSGDESPEEVLDWYRTGTRYARWAMFVMAGVGVLMVLLLIFLIDHPTPPG